MVLELSERESRLLEALVHVVDRLLDRPAAPGQAGRLIDSNALSAGESSLVALEQYGLVVDVCPPHARFGQWTDAGQKYRKVLSEGHVGEDFRHGLPVVTSLHDPAYMPSSELGINGREALLLEAVAAMAQQYYVAECAVAALVEYGLVEPVASGRYSGQWTEAGQKFEDWCVRRGIPPPQ